MWKLKNTTCSLTYLQLNQVFLQPPHLSSGQAQIKIQKILQTVACHDFFNQNP